MDVVWNIRSSLKVTGHDVNTECRWVALSIGVVDRNGHVNTHMKQ